MSQTGGLRGRVHPDRWLYATAAVYTAYVLSRLALIRRMPVFWDEGFHAVEAQTGLDDPGQRFQFLADRKPPLFNWVSIVLVDLGVTPLMAVRLVSLLAGLVTLTMVLLLARKLIGDHGALIAGSLYVVVPYLLVHDSYGLIDGLYTACVMTVLYLQVKLAERPSTALAITTGAVIAAGILTRQTGSLAIVLLPFSLLLFDFDARDRGARLLRWAGHALLAVLVALVLIQVEKLSPYTDIATPAQNRSISDALSDPFADVSDVWTSFAPAFTGYLGWPLLLLALGAAVLAFRRRDRLAVLLVLWALAPIDLVMLLLHYGFARYFLSALPPIVILAAYALVALDERLTGPLDGSRLRAARVVGLVVALVLPVALSASILKDPATAHYPSDDEFQFVAGWTAGTGLDRIHDALERDAPPGTSVVAAVSYTPWNLASLFDHPVRIPLGRIPYADGVRVDLPGGRTLEFVPAGSARARDAEFVLQHSVFGLPASIDLSEYRLVASFARPGGSTFRGQEEPRTTVQLYERVAGHS